MTTRGNWPLGVVLSIFIVLANSAVGEAKSLPVFFSFGGETTAKIVDFPDTDHFLSQDGYVDAGVIYKQITILFLPIWNYDIRWAGYLEEDPYSYIPLTREELKDLAESAEVTLPEVPVLPFWTSYGGKIVFLILLLSLLWYWRSDKGETENEGT